MSLNQNNSKNTGYSIYISISKKYMKNPILSRLNNAASINKENNFQHLQNMIVRYVYQETSSIENSKIEPLLQSNEKLKQFFYEIVNLKKQMDDCQTRHKPSNEIIEKILNYSKK